MTQEHLFEYSHNGVRSGPRHAFIGTPSAFTMAVGRPSQVLAQIVGHHAYGIRL